VSDWEPIQRRDPFAAASTGGRKPSIEGRDTLAWAMAELVPKPKPVKKRPFHWPKWLTWKRTVALVVVDLILASIGWHYLFTANPGAAKGAFFKTISAVEHRDWSAVYDSLCRSDRAQINESDLALEGNLALEQLGPAGLDHATVTSVTPVSQSLGPLVEPQAAQLAGELYPVVGQPSPYKIVVVHEIPDGWRVCMSAGGFSMLGYTAPLGAFTP
jgi:hypothetical protein